MSKVPMTALTGARFDEGFVARGGSFEAANEENARLYEQRGLARKIKDKRPERTQNVGADEEPKPNRARKTRQTKE